MKEEGITFKFTANTYYKSTGCDTEISVTTKTEVLSDVIDSFKDFLKGVGFSNQSINNYFEVESECS